MRPYSKTPLVIMSAVLAAGLTAWLSDYGIALNSSTSMPRGLYLVNQLQEVQRGQVVALCIPNESAANIYKARDYLPAGSACPVGLPRLLKPVVALPGDSVEIGAAGTSVNGFLLPNSQVFDADSNGKPMEHLPIGWAKRMGKDEYFVLANHRERSLDSRYYGTVQRADLKSQARPIFTF